MTEEEYEEVQRQFGLTLIDIIKARYLPTDESVTHQGIDTKADRKPMNTCYRCDECKKYDLLKPTETCQISTSEEFKLVDGVLRDKEGKTPHDKIIEVINHYWGVEVPKAQHEAFNKLLDEAKAKDDGWKPWPPEDWDEIKPGIFDVKSRTDQWIFTKTGDQIIFSQGCPINEMKFWRQDG